MVLIGERRDLEHIHQMLYSEDYQFIIIDIKTWEKNVNYILEVGITLLLSSPTGEFYPERQHYCIRDYFELSNSTDEFTNHREGFAFGTSCWSTMRELYAYLEHLFNQDRVVVIGHDFIQHFQRLRERINIPDDIMVYDMVDLWQESHLSLPTLKELLDNLGIRYKRKNLNNAGNDASFIMSALLKMAL